MIVQAAGQFCLLELSSDVFVRHFVQAGFDEVGLLRYYERSQSQPQTLVHTSSSDHARPPPVDEFFR